MIERRFEKVHPELKTKAIARRPVTLDDLRAQSVLYLDQDAASLLGR